MTKRFSASSAGRLMACPASANLELAIPGFVEPPRVVGKSADHGTSIHEIFEEVWELSPRDMDMFAQCVAYVAALRKTRRFNKLIEATVKATWLQDEPETTVDLALYTQDELHILDTKTGRIRVDVHDNKQLMYYAVTLAHLAPKAKGVTLHILQPWAEGNIESVFVSASELNVFKDEAIEAERKIKAKDLTFAPSDNCTFCPANPHGRGAKAEQFCPAMMQLLYPTFVDEAEILGS